MILLSLTSPRKEKILKEAEVVSAF